MFTLTTLLGGFHGLVVLPVVLSFLGGNSLGDDGNDIEALKARAATANDRNAAHPGFYPANKTADFDMWGVKGGGDDSKIKDEMEMTATATQQEILPEGKGGTDDGNR
mmetsp:Transcript_1729/g.2495  ORF Transcript_1729/g.2495 Transcript_1729/m.2495 type:complete len:108 (-) Transcript_1729:477-800(-)